MSGSISATTLAYIGAASSVIGTGISAIGSMKQGEAASASANYNAAVATNNATIAKQNATYAANAGEQKAAMEQAKTKATVGAIVAGQAASGIDVNSGSALKVRDSAQKLGQLDAMTIRSNAARSAYGYTNEASSYESQSQLDKFAADNDITAGEIGAGSTVLSGAGNAAMNYANFQNKGGFG